MTITAQDHARISAAIRAVEARTSGELVCVLARASSEYAAAPLLWAALTALLAPWPLILLTQWPVRSIFAAQIMIYIAALVLFSSRRLRVALTPPRHAPRPGPSGRKRAIHHPADLPHAGSHGGAGLRVSGRTLCTNHRR